METFVFDFIIIIQKWELTMRGWISTISLNNQAYFVLAAMANIGIIHIIQPWKKEFLVTFNNYMLQHFLICLIPQYLVVTMQLYHLDRQFQRLSRKNFEQVETVNLSIPFGTKPTATAGFVLSNSSINWWQYFGRV